MPRKEAPDTSFESYVKEVAGVDGLRVVKSIESDGCTDEKIEQATKLKLVEIRSLLNQLHNHGIVEYTREKNMQSGWFTYTWRVNMFRAMQNYLTMKKREYEGLRGNRGVGEGTEIYACPKGCARLPFGKAIENNFLCTTCNAKLKFADGGKELKELEQKITVLERMLSTKTQVVTALPKPN